MRGLGLPDYPWERLAPYREIAASHPEGVLDLSIGTPVDPTPEHVQRALAQAADAHGYPTTAGTPELRESIARWFARRRGASFVDAARGVLPTIGSKELVAWLPTLLGLGRGDDRSAVAYPAEAYPTYDMGAQFAGVDGRVLDAADVVAGAPLEGVGLLWINSPGNPTGALLDVGQLRSVVSAARAAGVVVASDECYAELAWPGESGTIPDVPSLLDDRVTGGDYTGLLVAYSLSKQSNLAGYRAAFLAGDPDLVADLTNSRKHAGMIVPAPVQAAMIAALENDDAVAAQRETYLARRAVLLPAVRAAGFRIDHSLAGLYLWVTRGEDCWTTIEWLAERGIVAGPGEFYGPAAGRHVRLALTATDGAIAAAASRLQRAR